MSEDRERQCEATRRARQSVERLCSVNRLGIGLTLVVIPALFYCIFLWLCIAGAMTDFSGSPHGPTALSARTECGVILLSGVIYTTLLGWWVAHPRTFPMAMLVVLYCIQLGIVTYLALLVRAMGNS